MTKMDLSIVIVTWNSLAVIPACLESIFRHTRGLHFEAVVVDNGSTDGSPEWIEQHMPQVRLLKNKANLGFSAANNQGLRASTGRNVILLNPDTDLRDNALKYLCDKLDSTERAGACGGLLLYPGGEPQWSYGYYPSLSRMIWITLSGLLRTEWGRKPHAVIPALTDGSRHVEYICGADLMIRRTVLDRVGFLDENLFAYCEETDLCRRITAAGYEIWFYPEAKIVHHIGETFTPWKARLYYTSLFRYCKKHYGYWRPVKYYLLAKQSLDARRQGRQVNEEGRIARLRLAAIRECGLDYPPEIAP